MKPVYLILSLITVLLAGCSTDSITGPVDDGRALAPANQCSINTQPC